MKRWLCLGLYGLMAVCGWAQPADSLCFLKGDSLLLLQEFEALCYRHVEVKRAAAEALHFDTLPFISHRLETFRWQQVFSLAQPSVRVPEKELQVRMRQIFKYLPQNVTSSRLRQAEQFMDSLARALRQGADFQGCVQRFSDDKHTRWISRLEVPAELEKQAFGLQPGEVSPPFYTPMGLHLIQVLDRKERRPHGFDEEPPMSVEEASLSRLLTELKKKYIYTPHPAAIRQLGHPASASQVLFTLQGEAYTVADWALFARSCPASPRHQFEAFLTKSLLDRALHRLGQDFPEADAAFRSYRDSLLVYEFTRQQFLTDGVGEEARWRAYFEQHRADYRFESPKFQGVVIRAVSKRAAKQVRRFLKKLPESEWPEAVRLTFAGDRHPEVNVTSGVFVRGDHAWVDYRVFRQRKPDTQPDYPVVLVMGKKIKGPLSFEEVRQEVIRDCFRDWEEQWMKRFQAENGKEEGL